MMIISMHEISKKEVEKLMKNTKSRNQLMKWNESKKNYNEVILITEQEKKEFKHIFLLFSLNLVRITNYALIVLNICFFFLNVCVCDKENQQTIFHEKKPSIINETIPLLCLHWLNYSFQKAWINRYEFLCYYTLCVYSICMFVGCMEKD